MMIWYIGRPPRAVQIDDNFSPEPGLEPPVVLLGEDDPAMRHLVRSALVRAGFDVVEAATGSEVIDYLARSLDTDALYPPPDVVVSDVRLPAFSGLDVLRAVKAMDPITPVILITGFGNKELHAAARRGGAAAVWNKPLDIDALVQSVRTIVALD